MGLLGLADLVEANDRRDRPLARRSCLRSLRRGGPNPAWQPILGPKLVENRAANSHAHVPVEALGLVVSVLANGVPQPAHPRRDEIVAKNASRQATLNAAGN